jgi:hypothetical protein
VFAKGTEIDGFRKMQRDKKKKRELKVHRKRKKVEDRKREGK